MQYFQLYPAFVTMEKLADFELNYGSIIKIK